MQVGLLTKFIRNLYLLDGVAVLKLNEAINEDVSDLVNPVTTEKITACSLLNLVEMHWVEVSLSFGFIERANDRAKG